MLKKYKTPIQRSDLALIPWIREQTLYINISNNKLSHPRIDFMHNEVLKGYNK